MKKYKVAIIILLVFLCVLTALKSYNIIRNLYHIVYYSVKHNRPQEVIAQEISAFLRASFTNAFILGFSIFGIVTFAKMLQDKQLFTTVAEQPATLTSTTDSKEEKTKNQ